MVRTGDVQHKKKTSARYSSRVIGWQCSRSCGGGLQKRVVKCVNKETREEEKTSLCAQNTQPDSVQTCNTDRCKTEPGECNNIIFYRCRTVNDNLFCIILNAGLFHTFTLASQDTTCKDKKRVNRYVKIAIFCSFVKHWKN